MKIKDIFNVSGGIWIILAPFEREFYGGSPLSQESRPDRSAPQGNFDFSLFLPDFGFRGRISSCYKPIPACSAAFRETISPFRNKTKFQENTGNVSSTKHRRLRLNPTQTKLFRKNQLVSRIMDLSACEWCDNEDSDGKPRSSTGFSILNCSG